MFICVIENTINCTLGSVLSPNVPSQSPLVMEDLVPAALRPVVPRESLIILDNLNLQL